MNLTERATSFFGRFVCRVAVPMAIANAPAIATAARADAALFTGALLLRGSTSGGVGGDHAGPMGVTQAIARKRKSIRGNV